MQMGVTAMLPCWPGSALRPEYIREAFDPATGNAAPSSKRLCPRTYSDPLQALVRPVGNAPEGQHHAKSVTETRCCNTDEKSLDDKVRIG
jgi:hypothetical protein